MQPREGVISMEEYVLNFILSYDTDVQLCTVLFDRERKRSRISQGLFHFPMMSMMM